jgi:hypothetical protein
VAFHLLPVVYHRGGNGLSMHLPLRTVLTASSECGGIGTNRGIPNIRVTRRKVAAAEPAPATRAHQDSGRMPTQAPIGLRPHRDGRQSGTCLSPSTNRSALPARVPAKASCRAIVVLPTLPFALPTVIIIRSGFPFAFPLDITAEAMGCHAFALADSFYVFSPPSRLGLLAPALAPANSRSWP